MVIGLDSARKQLQWRLIYATLDVDSTGFAGRGCVFCQRSIPPGTEAATAESYPAANAQSVDLHSEAGTIKGESIVAQTGDAGQYTYRCLNSETARLSHDRGSSCGRWPHLVWQARTRDTQRTFQCDGKGPQSPLQSLWRFRGQFRPHSTWRGQCAQRFRAERNALCRRAHEMVPSTYRRRCRDAHRNLAWLPRLAWMHPRIRRWGKIVLRPRQGRHPRRCWRFLADCHVERSRDISGIRMIVLAPK